MQKLTLDKWEGAGNRRLFMTKALLAGGATIGAGIPTSQALTEGSAFGLTTGDGRTNRVGSMAAVCGTWVSHVGPTNRGGQVALSNLDSDGPQ
jgi:hypothetical protein